MFLFQIAGLSQEALKKFWGLGPLQVSQLILSESGAAARFDIYKVIELEAEDSVIVSGPSAQHGPGMG